MSFYSETLPLPERVFTVLRDLIHDHTGLFYAPEHRELLAGKLAPLALERGLHSFLEYYYLLKYDAPAAAAEWPHLIDALSVPETYFWREMDQVHALVEQILPRHLARTGGAPLRLWSAACATGEEPLTIAMVLEEGGWFARLPLQLVASDASARALQRARQGVYRERALRLLPSPLRERYFSQEREEWRVSPALHGRIQWHQVNLLDEGAVAPLARADIIFCRNAFIYFSERTISQTVSSFARYMPSPGYLCVGLAESLLRLTTDFQLQTFDKAFVYVK